MGSIRGEGGAGGGGGGGGLADLVDDTTPQLGGNLDVNGHNVGGVTPTELGYLSGVTSAIQTQLGNKQASNGNLDALAGQTGEADKVSYWTAAATLALATLTAFGRSLIAAADAAGVRTLLGLGTAATTDASAYQASDAELSAIAGLTSAADKGIQFTGAGTAGTYDLTAAGKALLDDADAAAQRSTLGAASSASPTLTGTVVIRQTGGVAGTDEIQLSHDGSNGIIESKDGALNLKASGAVRINLTSSIGIDASIADSATGGGRLFINKDGTSIFVMPSFVFSFRNAQSGSFDTGWARNAAGVLEINNGSAGTYRDLKLRAIESTQTTGTAPLTVASTTVVTNLNADKLDGLDAADLIAKSLVTTKGDIIAASASATVARLGVGTNGQVLTADSAQTLGIKWATPSGGGTLFEGVAILAPNGNDTTGAVGTSTAAPIPYATAQAAYDDGAKVMVLMPKNGSYGAITTGGAPLYLTVISYHSPQYGHNILGAISTAGGEIRMLCSTGPRSCAVGTVTTSAASLNAGAIYAEGFNFLQEVLAAGDSTSGTSGAQITLRNFICNASILCAGGQSATPGGTGGNAGNMLLEDGIAEASVGVSVSGGSGTSGAAGDGENPGGAGGNGGAAGTLTTRRLVGLFNLYANGGNPGAGGSDGGAGAGSDGTQGSAGTINDKSSRVDSVECSSDTNPGTIYLDRTTIDTSISASSGTINSRFSDYPTPGAVSAHNIVGSIIAGTFASS